MTDRRKWIVGIAALVVLAVLLLRPDGPGTRDGSGAVAEDGVPARTVGESIFDSSAHPDLSELLGIVGGLFLPDSGLALVERGEIHMVDLATGEARVIGRRGEGPREFGHIWTANHAPQGILVWDTLRRRAVFIGHDGEFLSSRGYRRVPFQDVFTSRPVGVGPDGRIVFRDGPDSFGGFGRGRLWDPAWYVVVQGDGEILRIAEARGEEMYYGEHRSDAVTMGHRTFDAATEDHLIIADTDRGAIAVLDWSGSQVAEIPMPGQYPIVRNAGAGGAAVAGGAGAGVHGVLQKSCREWSATRRGRGGRPRSSGGVLGLADKRNRARDRHAPDGLRRETLGEGLPSPRSGQRNLAGVGH